MRVADICTLLTVHMESSASVRDAAKLMRERHVGAVVVVDRRNGTRALDGILTDRDIAISVVAASMWMIENPHEGVVVPDQMPHDYILDIAKPYLGKWISERSDWTPLKDTVDGFAGFGKPSLDKKDPWQFKNFLITENNE